MPEKSKTTKGRKSGGNEARGGGAKNVFAVGKNTVVPAGATPESVGAELLSDWKQDQGFEWKVGDRYNLLVVLLKGQHAVSARKVIAQVDKEIGRSTLLRYGRVAKAFPEEVAAKYGMTKLEALLNYEQMVHVTPIVGDPGEVAIAVPTSDDATANKKFADCSLRDLRSALAHLHQHGTHTGPAHPPPPAPVNDAPSTADEKHELEVLRSGIEASQGTHGAIQIRTRKGPRGLLVDLVGIPVGQVAHVLSTIVDKQLADALEEARKKGPKVLKAPAKNAGRDGKKR